VHYWASLFNVLQLSYRAIVLFSHPALTFFVIDMTFSLFLATFEECSWIYLASQQGWWWWSGSWSLWILVNLHSMNNIFDNFVALTSWVGELVIDIMVTWSWSHYVWGRMWIDPQIYFFSSSRLTFWIYRFSFQIFYWHSKTEDQAVLFIGIEKNFFFLPLSSSNSYICTKWNFEFKSVLGWGCLGIL
jgi:hypothetical protein